MLPSIFGEVHVQVSKLQSAIERAVRQLASRAALDACRTSPLAFDGDKRGRMREVLAGIVNRIPSPLDTASLKFIAEPDSWSYAGSTKPSGAMKLVSARIALPDPACVINLADWLPEETAQRFVAPKATGEEIGPRFFNVSMTEWRLVVRRMVRCGLAAAFPADACPPALSGGVFAVAKDSKRDRLICDRRPQNSQEGSVGRGLLPFCPRLRRLILQRSCTLGVDIIDTRNTHMEFTSLTRVIVSTSIKLTLLVRTHRSLIHAFLPLGCTVCLTSPWTLFMLTL